MKKRIKRAAPPWLFGSLRWEKNPTLSCTCFCSILVDDDMGIPIDLLIDIPIFGGLNDIIPK